MSVLSQLSLSEILQAFDRQFESKGWRSGDPEITALFVKQSWQRRDQTGVTWRIQIHLIDAVGIQILPFGACAQDPLFQQQAKPYLGELTIYARDLQAQQVRSPQNYVAPSLISNHFAQMLLGDYRLGELPPHLPVKIPTPPHATLIASRTDDIQTDRSSKSDCSSKSDRFHILFDVAAPIKQIWQFYDRSLKNAGWKSRMIPPDNRLCTDL